MIGERKPTMDDKEQHERGLKLRVEMFGRDLADTIYAYGEERFSRRNTSSMPMPMATFGSARLCRRG